MKTHDLAREVAKATRIRHHVAFDIVKKVFDTIIEQLKEGESVHIPGFGKFEVFTRKAREGVDPRNPKKRINLPEIKVAKFRVGNRLKNEVKKS